MTVIVLRAVSGAGKSTFAKRLVADSKCIGGIQEDLAPNMSNVVLPNAKGAYVVSTDDYFMVDGKYKFDPKKLAQAHQATQEKFLGLVREAGSTIIVDNTNTQLWEFAWYVVTAQLYGHRTQIATLLVDPAIAYQRNTHGVPAETVFRMDRQLREDTARIPPHWSSKVLFV